MSQLDAVRQATALHKEALMSQPNVIGLGVGYKTTRGRVSDELSVVVLVRRKLPPAVLSEEALLPQELEGIRTDVIEVGDLRALADRTDRWRPAPAGVSLGHYQVTAGTFGCIVHDRTSGTRLVLSNNHVLANCNQAQVGDPILQPGVADGGVPERDTFALLERFRPLRFDREEPICKIAQNYVRLGNKVAKVASSRHRLQAYRINNPFVGNLVDAALAKPLDDSTALDEIMDIGVITGAAPAVLGMTVRKSGRTTACTTGQVLVVDSTVRVGYGYAGELYATFDNQVVTSPMSQGGDSGSLVVTGDSPKAVGLLFGGSAQASVCAPIQAVLDNLNVDLPGPRQSLVERQAALTKAQAVRQAYQEQLMAKANVVGVGVGLRHKDQKRTDEVALVVMVRQKMPKVLLRPEDVLPAEIEGVPVDVKEVGEISLF